VESLGRPKDKLTEHRLRRRRCEEGTLTGPCRLMYDDDEVHLTYRVREQQKR